MRKVNELTKNTNSKDWRIRQDEKTRNVKLGKTKLERMACG